MLFGIFQSNIFVDAQDKIFVLFHGFALSLYRYFSPHLMLSQFFLFTLAFFLVRSLVFRYLQPHTQHSLDSVYQSTPFIWYRTANMYGLYTHSIVEWSAWMAFTIAQTATTILINKRIKLLYYLFSLTSCLCQHLTCGAFLLPFTRLRQHFRFSYNPSF